MLNKYYHNGVSPFKWVFLLASIFFTQQVSSTEILTEKNIIHQTQPAVISVSGTATANVEAKPFSADILLLEKGNYTEKIQAIIEYKTTLIKSIGQHKRKSQGLFTVGELRLQVVSSAKKSVNINGLVHPIINFPKVNVNKYRENDSVDQQVGGFISINSVNKNTSDIHASTNNTEFFHVATRKISVTFTNQMDYQHFIDQVIKIGVYTIFPTPLSEKLFSAQYQKGLFQASMDAKNKAEKMLTNIGSGKVILRTLTETSNKHKEYKEYLRIIQPKVFSSANGYQKISVLNEPSIFGKYSMKITVQAQFTVE
jgi:hypothetical protein